MLLLTYGESNIPRVAPCYLAKCCLTIQRMLIASPYSRIPKSILHHGGVLRGKGADFPEW